MDREVSSVFEILEEKNSCLLEFHRINTDEILRLSQGRIDNLENFYLSRELLLRAISRLDSKIAKNNSNGAGPNKIEVNQEERRKLLELLNLKKNMVMSIVDQDMTILSLMEKLHQGKERFAAS